MHQAKMTIHRAAGLAIVAALGLHMSLARADVPDPCANYSWDVSHERALFASQAVAATAGGAAPLPITVNRLYSLHLIEQGSVNFVTPPTKKMPVDPAFGGLASLEVATAGIYRVSGDSPFWIDVVVAGKALESRDYQGQKGCNSPHKIVEFELPAGVPVLLEFSNAGAAEIHFSVTAAPAGKP